MNGNRKTGKTLRAVCAMLAAALLMMCFTAFAEDSGTEWNFPVALKDINQNLLVIASSESPLTEEDIPSDLITLKARKNNEDGTNANSGLYMASNSTVVVSRSMSGQLLKMVNAAELQGVTLYVRAGYRSFSDQTRLYDRAERTGSLSYVQKAGESDYQTGLAVTLVGRDWRGTTLTEEFGATAEAKWLASNCYRFGFIIRYPEGKEMLTGNAWEPWHLRYVGTEVATYMYRNNLCLEEFVAAFNSALDEFVANGGDIEAALAMGVLPEGPVELDDADGSGDHDIMLFHD